MDDISKRGLFAGDCETEEGFWKRVEKSQALPLKPALAAVFERCFELYGMRPDWVEVELSDEDLLPWHAAVTHIWQEDGCVRARLQLRSCFAFDTHYWTYHRDEVLLHELSHIARQGFSDGAFEEFFAYRSSRSPLRRFLGSVTAWPRVVLGGVIAVCVASWSLFILSFMTGAQWPLGVSVCMSFAAIAMAVAKAWSIERTYVRAKKAIEGCAHPDHFLFRLTTKEICDLAEGKMLAFEQGTPRQKRLWEDFFRHS